MDHYKKDSRNAVKRLPKRGHYDKETVFKILDDGFLCHLSYVIDGQPFVIPTSYGREGNTIYVHGSSKSRTLMESGKGIPVCLAVTHLDGIVLARSLYNHSMNYRSVVIFGNAVVVPDEKKNHVLKIISDQILKGRWEEARQPDDKELKATAVLAIEIDQASAKIRTGDPGDHKEDYALPVWAGVIPMKTVYEKEIPDPAMDKDYPVPASVKNLL